MTKKSNVPTHLSEPMRQFYRKIVRTYVLSDQHFRLLEAACEAHDRKSEARALLDAEGLTVSNRHGEKRPHPAVGIERDSAVRFARMLREIGLSDEPSDSRPSGLSGRYKGRR